MSRSQLLLAVAAALALLALPAVLTTFAHDDHAPPPSDGFDPFAPKIIPPETAVLIGLVVEEADFGVMERVERLSGVVRFDPNRVAVISPPIAGTIASVSVQPGTVVRAGDTLVELDSPELARLRYELSQLDSERIELELAQQAAYGRSDRAALDERVAATRLELASQELERAQQSREAVAANLVNQKKIAVLTHQSEQAAARLERELASREAEGLSRRIAAVIESRRALADALGSIAGDASTDLQGGRLVFRSLRDGVVTSRAISVGQHVQPGEQMIVVADAQRVQIIAELPESRLDSLTHAQGKTVRLRQPGKGTVVRAEGVVRHVNPKIDSTKRTAHVLIDADNAAGALRDGMFVEVAIVLEELDFAVVVPHEAVLKDGPERYVFIRDGEVFKRQAVAIGARDDRFFEITDGLVPGDEIVVRGAYAVSQIRARGASSDHDHGHDHGHQH